MSNLTSGALGNSSGAAGLERLYKQLLENQSRIESICGGSSNVGNGNGYGGGQVVNGGS